MVDFASGDFTSNEQSLSEQASHLLVTGDLDGAKRIAAQLTDRILLRHFWMGVLYQLFRSGNLQEVKETIASLADEFLWTGTWIYDLIIELARSGDTAGAMWIISKLPEKSPRATFLMLIAFAQADRSDFAGAEQTIEKLGGFSDKFWRNTALVKVARARMVKGDTDEAQRLASMIDDSAVRDTVFSDKSSSSTQSDG